MPNKQWHPAFLAALREAFRDAHPGKIEIIPEVALSSRPLDVDFVIVKKNRETRMGHPMAAIFRRYNLIEYKSPVDYLEANDFDKGMALAFLYKALRLPKLQTLDEFTFTYASSGYPRAMLGMLKTRGLEVIEAQSTPGIYKVNGWIFPLQVVVINELADPERAYMFTAFVHPGGSHRVPATSLMLRKYLAEPANENLKQLVDFIFENRLVHSKEVEEVLQMAREIGKDEEQRVWEILNKYPVSRRWLEQGRAEARAEGQAEVICSLLDAKFGPESADLQEMVRKLTNQEKLLQVAIQALSVDSREEAHKIIQEAVQEG